MHSVYLNNSFALFKYLDGGRASREFSITNVEQQNFLVDLWSVLKNQFKNDFWSSEYNELVKKGGLVNQDGFIFPRSCPNLKMFTSFENWKVDNSSYKLKYKNSLRTYYNNLGIKKMLLPIAEGMLFPKIKATGDKNVAKYKRITFIADENGLDPRLKLNKVYFTHPRGINKDALSEITKKVLKSYTIELEPKIRSVFNEIHSSKDLQNLFFVEFKDLNIFGGFWEKVR